MLRQYLIAYIQSHFLRLESSSDRNDNADTVLVIPAAPADQGAPDTAPVPSAPAFVDAATTNQRGDARYATLATNAGVRVLGGMLDIWKPLTEIVDAGVTAPAVDGFPAVVASTWTGLPNDGTNGGTIVNAIVHNANIDGATLELRLGAGEQGRVNVGGTATIAGGTLRVRFLDGYKPAVGDTLTVLAATSLKGKFDTIAVDGFTATPTWSATSLQLRLSQ